MSLNGAEVTEFTVESAPLALLNEWLAKWFDGNKHTAGGVEMEFPKVNRAFNEGAPVQPLHQFEGGADAEIRVLQHPRGDNVMSEDAGRNLVTSLVMYHFWVRAKVPGEGKSEWLAQRVAELLRGLLGNPSARIELAEKGVAHLLPQGAPSAIPSTEYAMRLVSCSARVQYVVRF